MVFVYRTISSTSSMCHIYSLYVLAMRFPFGRDFLSILPRHVSHTMNLVLNYNAEPWSWRFVSPSFICPRHARTCVYITHSSSAPGYLEKTIGKTQRKYLGGGSTIVYPVLTTTTTDYVTDYVTSEEASVSGSCRMISFAWAAEFVLVLMSLTKAHGKRHFWSTENIFPPTNRFAPVERYRGTPIPGKILVNNSWNFSALSQSKQQRSTQSIDRHFSPAITYVPGPDQGTRRITSRGKRYIVYIQFRFFKSISNVLHVLALPFPWKLHLIMAAGWNAPLQMKTQYAFYGRGPPFCYYHVPHLRGLYASPNAGSQQTIYFHPMNYPMG